MASHPLIERARQHGRTLLTELESKQVLHDLGIPTTPGQLATSEEDAVRAADTIGYPVVLKIASPDIVHKSEVGGVHLHLQDGEAVRQAFRTMQQSVATRAPGARIDGIIVQPMAAPGVEVIVGMSKDATFGPVLMFGLGGVLVEILKDVTFRIVPLSKRDAHEMMADIFNSFDRQTEVRFMSALELISADSADRIKNLMFTFDDLAKLDSGSAQTLMRSIDKFDPLVNQTDAAIQTAEHAVSRPQ